jgi:gluconate 2-dehydrogenase gamma chain
MSDPTQAEPDVPGADAAQGEDDELSRRLFVQRLTFFGGGAVLLGGACKKDEAPVDAGHRAEALTSSHRSFTDVEWATLGALVERVLPKDEDPGALDANVPEYIDRILQTPQLEQMRANFVPGVAAIERRAQRMFKVGFAAATPAQQDELITIFKNSPEKSGEARWYELLVVLVLEGFLGDPSYGGNKDEAGWKLVGFKLVGRNVKGDPAQGYDGSKALRTLTCGVGRGC